MSLKDNRDTSDDGKEEQTRDIRVDEMDRNERGKIQNILECLLALLGILLCWCVIVTYRLLHNTLQKDIPARPANPPRTQARRRAVNLVWRGYHLRKYRTRDTCPSKGMKTGKRTQYMRVNTEPFKETRKTSSYQKSCTEDKNKVLSPSKSNTKSIRFGKSPVSCSGYAMIGKDDSHCKVSVDVHEQVINSKMIQKTKTSVKEVDDSNDINTCRQEKSNWNYNHTFQTIQHPDTVAGHCTLSDESDDSIGGYPPCNSGTAGADHLNNETQAVQVSDESNNDAIVYGLQERGEAQRPVNQNCVIDLDLVRYPDYRMISIYHMIQLLASLNNLDENRSQENASQRAPIIDLSLNRGPMIDLRQSRHHRFQNRPAVAIHSSHGRESCCLCGMQNSQIWCLDCEARFCVDDDVLYHGQSGRQSHRRQTF